MSKRPLALFSTARAGSNYCYLLLYQYLFQTEQVRGGLGEFFNRHWVTGKDTGTGITQTPNLQRIGLSVPKRAALIKKYHGSYLFKVFPDHLFLNFRWKRHSSQDQARIEWLMQNHEWVFLERKNLFEQLLSYLILQSTKVGYDDDGISPPALSRKKLGFNRSHFDYFEKVMWLYMHAKQRYRPKLILTYEEMVAQDPNEVLNHLGLKAPPTAIEKNCLPREQGKGDKMLLFKDPHLIEKAYRDSFLNKVYPI